MKKVLVIYFSQTGQLSHALKSTLAALENNKAVQLHYEQLIPTQPFPFPWSYMEFFNVFPECVRGTPVALRPFTLDVNVDYDLIVIAYQPWFLSVSIPVNSFLQSVEGKKIVQDKPVITILACRNMWLNAQEKMKLQLKNCGAKLVGHIAFVDKSANLISLVTVLAFALGGVKEKFLGLFPRYGVSDKDLNEVAPALGKIILESLQEENYLSLQTNLNAQGAVNVKSNLLLLEGRGKVLFPLYANYITRNGEASISQRRRRVRIFGIVLPLAILILSPLITILSRFAPLLFPEKIKKEKAYYSQNTLR